MARLHDIDAERALIGAAMINAGVLDQVELPPDAFLDFACRRTWAIMLELHASGQPLDHVLIVERADRAAHVSSSFLGQCAVATPTADNASFYADIVRKHATTRSVLQATAAIQEMHRVGSMEGDELLDAALQAIAAIDLDKPRETLTIGDVVKERFAEYDKMLKALERGESAMSGVPTGIKDLDRILSGLQPGIVTLLAARPGMGKSALALQIADHASAHGFGVHVISLEDSRSAYADRAISSGARVPVTRLRAAQLQRGDMQRVMRRANELCARKNWRYDDISGLSVEAAIRSVRRIRRENDTKLVIIDYLQILRRPKRYQNVNDALEQNINALADAAKHDNVAYLVLSQLSRDCEKREDRRPRAADLRDSGSLEQRAKCVLAIYRGSMYGEPRANIDYDDSDPDNRRPSPEEWQRRMELLILKQNHGPLGMVLCEWDGPCTRIEDAKCAR